MSKSPSGAAADNKYTLPSPCIQPDQKAFLVITGASRGIGRAIALSLANFFTAESRILLLARTVEGLEETRHLINEAVGLRCFVQVEPIDLSDPPEERMRGLFSGYDASLYDLALIVHSVGTIGDVTRPADQPAPIDEWQDFFALNVYHVTRLNAQFLQLFAPIPQGAVAVTEAQASVRPIPLKRSTSIFVVNITSKCATSPYDNLTMYCTSRAARHMYFQVLAGERPDLRVLNYSPGVVDTAMTVDLQAHSASFELRERYRAMRTCASMVTPAVTAAELLRVLKLGHWASGAKIDFYESKKMF